MKDILLNAIAMTLQNTIAALGPIPDRHGDWIREDMEEVDPVRIPALGCYLEDCIKSGSYEPLDRAAVARSEHLERKRKGFSH